MADVDINKFRASVVREGSKPASPGFIVSEGQSPTDPAGSGQNHLPVTIATAATGLSITESQVLGGAGTVGQYIRGDGSLADFPESSGGGSSVSYYLNGSVNQGTIGGVAYKDLNKVPVLGAGTDFTINADGYIASFITDAGDPNLLEISGGNWNFETYFSASSSGGTPTFYVELYKVNSGGTATLIASNSTFPELIAFGTNIISYFSTLAVPTTALALTDRLAIRYYVTHSGRTITLHTEDNHLCQIITTFTTGLTALNGLTAQIQNFAVGTSGTDFAISSATATHTFNLPTASATNRGALSSADWTTFNNKTSNLGTVTSVGLSSATSGVTIGSSPVTTSGTITLAIATASGSQNGLLSSTDWTTFNGKQNALTNPVTGTGTTNYLPKFTGSTTIGNSLFTDNGTNAGYNNGGVAARTFIIQATSGRPLALEVIENANVHAIYFYPNNSGFNRISSDYMSGGTFLPLSLTGRENNADLVCQTSGNITIGTTTDNGARLQVSGTATFSSTGNAVRISSTSTSSNVQLYITNNNNGDVYTGVSASDGTSVFTGTTAYSGYIGTNLNVPFYIATNGIARLTLASTGAATFSSSVTATNNFNLINSSGSVGALVYQESSVNKAFVQYLSSTFGTAARANSLELGTIASGSFIAFRPLDVEAMRITSDGNLLVGATSQNGTSSKQYMRQSGDGSFKGLNIVSAATGQFVGSMSINASGNLNFAQSYLDGAGSFQGITFDTSGSERMRITSGGNVLIGTTTDVGAKLAVNGVISSLGNAFLSNSGNLTMTGTYQTIFTAGTDSAYFLTVQTNSSDGTYAIFALYNENSTERATSTILGNNIQVQFSGNDVQIRSGNGVSYTVTYGTIRIK